MSAAPREPGRPGLWRHRDFLLLWAGQSISELGSAVTVLALPLTAVVVLGASTFDVGLLAAATTVPFLLIALPAGLAVDRMAKRGLMIGCDAARMLIIGSVPIAAGLGKLTLFQLYAVAVATGVLTLFFDVAYQSFTPALIDHDQLPDGNGKLAATQAFAQVAGPGLGGGLFGLLRAGALAADATVSEPWETPEMLAEAMADVLVTGVVSWVDLESPDVADSIGLGAVNLLAASSVCSMGVNPGARLKADIVRYGARRGSRMS